MAAAVRSRQPPQLSRVAQRRFGTHRLNITGHDVPNREFLGEKLGLLAAGRQKRLFVHHRDLRAGYLAKRECRSSAKARHASFVVKMPTTLPFWITTAEPYLCSAIASTTTSSEVSGSTA